MVKNYGGKGELILPKGEKLITVTWKDEHLWYLTRSMSANDSVETYILKIGHNMPNAIRRYPTIVIFKHFVSYNVFHDIFLIYFIYLFFI